MNDSDRNIMAGLAHEACERHCECGACHLDSEWCENCEAPDTAHRGIIASHYGIEEQRIAATWAAQTMYAELPLDVRIALRTGTYIGWNFVTMSNAEYARRTGDIGAHLGAVSEALKLLARQAPTI